MAKQALKSLELNENQVLTVHELSSFLNVHHTTVYRLIHEKKIPAFRVGSDWRISQKAIDQWMKSQERESRR
jgi:excisionase family DNA binding protein